MKFNSDSVKQIQEKTNNVWPAKHYYFINGWILRLCDGHTQRPNSVLPLNYTGKDLIEDLKRVESIFQKYKYKPRFMMHDYFEPSNLAQVLVKRGYKKAAPTFVMVSNAIAYIPVKNENIDFFLSEYRTKEIADFLNLYTTRPVYSQNEILDIVNNINIPLKMHVVGKNDEKIIGTVLGVLDEEGDLYIADLMVRKEERRSGLATVLMYKIVEWAKSNDLKRIWLQVEEHNEAAIRFYQKLGLKICFSYHYMEKNK
ncbi:MAG: GNAT family N-acetyltransferase [Candidatus Kariarchaeaceae archaeon]